jgi:hypothetical protein
VYRAVSSLGSGRLMYRIVSSLGSGRLCTGLFRRKVVVICVLGYFVVRQWSSMYRVILLLGSVLCAVPRG